MAEGNGMHQDVVDLRAFYQTDLGQVAQRMIRRRIRRFWPDLKGLSLLGLGFASPYLRPFKNEAERIFAIMPAGQGVTAWPLNEPNIVALAEESDLPLPDMSVDRVLLVHGLEQTEHLRQLMREIWRVLAGGGRLLAVVPNRRGLWARIENTPFGHGRPFSSGQLSRTLRENLFVPEREDRALYMPPLRSRFLLAASPAWEEVGWRWLHRFSGVIMVEASKQLYQLSRTADPVRRRKPFLVPIGRPIAHPLSGDQRALAATPGSAARERSCVAAGALRRDAESAQTP